MMKVATVLLLAIQFGFAQWNNWTDAASLRSNLLKAADSSKTYYSQFDWFAPRQSGSLDTEYSKVTGVQPLIYGLDFYYASGTYFTKAFIQANRRNLVSIVKGAWKIYKAVPLFSWHLENPYVTSNYSEMMGCRFRYSKKIPDYPSNHRYVVHEILNGEGEQCGFGNRSKIDNVHVYKNPREWFESRVAEVADILNEFLDGENKPIPVIIRLWHECEDDWMWWGPNSVSADDYKKFFILTENLIKKYAPTAEILWAYSPDRYWKKKNFLKWYPGDEYVDIIGYDDYSIGQKGQDFNENIDRARFVSEVANSKNKPSALFETANSHKQTANDFFENYLLKIIHDKETSFSIVQTWSIGKFSTIEQKNDRKSFLQNQSVIVKRNE